MNLLPRIGEVTNGDLGLGIFIIFFYLLVIDHGKLKSSGAGTKIYKHNAEVFITIHQGIEFSTKFLCWTL